MAFGKSTDSSICTEIQPNVAPPGLPEPLRGAQAPKFRTEIISPHTGKYWSKVERWIGRVTGKEGRKRGQEANTGRFDQSLSQSIFYIYISFTLYDGPFSCMTECWPHFVMTEGGMTAVRCPYLLPCGLNRVRKLKCSHEASTSDPHITFRTETQTQSWNVAHLRFTPVEVEVLRQI